MRETLKKCIPAAVTSLLQNLLEHVNMPYHIFLSLQVKRSMIISNKKDINELLHELLNDLRRRILINQERSGKSHRIITQYPFFFPKKTFCLYEQKTAEKEKLKLSRISLFHMKTAICPKYFANDCPSKYFLLITRPRSLQN